MHVDIIKARWPRLGAKLQRKWPRLTNDDIAQLDGHRDYLVDKLRERYGIAKEKAEMQVKEFERSLGQPAVVAEMPGPPRTGGVPSCLPTPS